MTERIKKHWDITLASAIGLILAIVGIVGIMTFPTNPVFSDVATDVVITATVSPWMTFTSNQTAITLSPALVDTGGITHVGSTTEIILTVGTNHVGYNIDIVSATTGLGYGTNASKIQLSTATGTIVAGIMGYGVQASSSNMTIATPYNWATGTDDVGRITAVSADFAGENATGTGRIAYMRVLAACGSFQIAGSYVDKITLTAIPVAP